MHISINSLYAVLNNVEIHPESLNLLSQGKPISVYLELIDGLPPEWIQVESLWLSVDGTSQLYAIPDHAAIGDHNQNGIPDLMVKFDRQALQAMLAGTPADGWDQITVYGAINGYHFQGVDTIKVLGAGQ